MALAAGTELLELGAVGGELAALRIDDLGRGLSHEAVVGELALRALDLGAQRVAPLRDAPPDLLRVDLLRREDLHRAHRGDRLLAAACGTVERDPRQAAHELVRNGLRRDPRREDRPRRD